MADDNGSGNGNKAIMITITIITIVLMSVLLVIAVTIIRLKMDNNNLTSSVQMLKDKLLPSQGTNGQVTQKKEKSKQDAQKQQQDGVEEL